MPWITPTIDEVRRIVRDDLSASLPGSDASIPNTPLRGLADADAAVAYLVLLYLDWLSNQLLPDRAEFEWLVRHANIWLGGPLPATYAVGTVQVTGVAGTPIPQFTRFASSTGILFETTEATVVGATATTIPVQAVDAGSASNLAAGAPLTLTSAITGVDGIAVADLIGGGSNEEAQEAMRARVIDRIQNPPMGGDAHDYEVWAREVPGVTRAWVYPMEQGPGSMTVRFMMDEVRADPDPEVDGFPLPADVEDVQEHIDSVRPVTVKDLWVEAPLPYPIDFTIQGLFVDDPPVRTAIEDSVSEMFFERCPPGQKVWRAWLDEAISTALGEQWHELTFESTEMPSPGYMPVLGTVTYLV